MRKCAFSFLFAALLLAGLTSGPTHAAPATCENGVVVPDPEANRGLRHRLRDLLAAKTQLDRRRGINWSGETPIGEWDGVSLGGEPPRVVEVDLRSTGLRGGIAPQFGRLTALRGLYLQNNKLTGPIPPELGSLRDLEVLWLFRNDLDGPIPPELGSLGNLREMWLADNALTGPVPEQLGHLHDLRLLRLEDNHLTGLIPAGAGIAVQFGDPAARQEPADLDDSRRAGRPGQPAQTCG